MRQLGKDKKSNKLMSKKIIKNLTSLSNRSISDTLLNKLIDMIMDGTIEPGYVFPNENAMCEQLNIGRSTLRETYKALMVLGYITRTKTGTYVNDNDQIIASTPIDSMMKKSDLRDLWEFREMLEVEAAGLAAERATDLGLSSLQGIVDKMKQNSTDIKFLTQSDGKFHYGIIEMSENALIKNTMIAVTSGMEKTAYSGYQNDVSIINHSIIAHQKIIDALKTRDKRLARAAMRAHINEIYRTLNNLSRTNSKK